MKYLSPLVIYYFLMIFIISCENPKEIDTTAPSVVITYPINGSTVSKIVNITCMATDNEALKQVELWVDGKNTGNVDIQEPFELQWDTRVYQDKTEHVIIIRAIDVNNNKADSDPINLIVDNTGEYPNSISISKISYKNGQFEIVWNESYDMDFYFYELEKSYDEKFNITEIIYKSYDVHDTIFYDTDINPLVYQYYRINVYDSLEFKSLGIISSSILDAPPPAVGVTSVAYNQTEMVVTWDKSTASDFKEYKILYAISEFADKDTITIIKEIEQTTYTLNEFNPIIKNWFWVAVVDSFNQTTVGWGSSNNIDSPPQQSEFYPILYKSNSLNICWEENTDMDFQKYELYEALDESFNDKSSIFISENKIDTCLTIENRNENGKYFYELNIYDIWDQKTISRGVYYPNDPPMFILIELPTSIAIPGLPEQYNFELIRVTVSDPQGLADIESVFFYSILPDGKYANNGAPFELYDNGLPFNMNYPSEEVGDELAGDGIYSITIVVNGLAQPGTYKFSFFIRDRYKTVTGPEIREILLK